MTLRRWSSRESAALIGGSGRPPDGLAWAADYPAEDTFIALGLLRLAHDAAGTSRGDRPRWWLYQIVVGVAGQDLIVGDIGFHGPPPARERAVVEIGYHVVPQWRGRGIATRACAEVLREAWRGGAAAVRAEAAAPASQAVLRRCGFVRQADDWFEASRP